MVIDHKILSERGAQWTPLIFLLSVYQYRLEQSAVALGVIIDLLAITRPLFAPSLPLTVCSLPSPPPPPPLVVRSIAASSILRTFRSGSEANDAEERGNASGTMAHVYEVCIVLHLWIMLRPESVLHRDATRIWRNIHAVLLWSIDSNNVTPSPHPITHRYRARLWLHSTCYFPEKETEERISRNLSWRNLLRQIIAIYVDCGLLCEFIYIYIYIFFLWFTLIFFWISNRLLVRRDEI